MNDYLLIVRNRGSTKLLRVYAPTHKQAVNKACSLHPNKFINYKSAKKMDLLNAQKEAIEKSKKSAHKQYIVLLKDGDFEVENDLSLEKGMDIYATYHKGVKVETKKELAVKAVEKASHKMEKGAIEKAVKENSKQSNKMETKTKKAAVKKVAAKKAVSKPAVKKAATNGTAKEGDYVHPSHRPIKGGAALSILNELKKGIRTKAALAKAADTPEGNIAWYLGKIRNNGHKIELTDKGYQLKK